MHRHLLTIILCCALTSPAHAGAWLQPKGQGQLITQATYYSASHYFDFDGKQQKQSRFRKYELQPYAEYGMFDNLTIGGSAYAQALKQGGDNYGIADPEIFARTRVWHNATQTVSLQPLIKFPSRFESKNPPRGGSKSADAEISVLYGRTMNILSDRDYLDVRTGYRVRGSGLGDQWRSDVALGLNVTDKLLIIPALRTTIATEMTQIAGYTENGDLDYSLAKADVTAMYRLNAEQWLQASISKDIAGAQTGDGYGASIGYGRSF